MLYITRNRKKNCIRLFLICEYFLIPGLFITVPCKTQILALSNPNQKGQMSSGKPNHVGKTVSHVNSPPST